MSEDCPLCRTGPRLGLPGTSRTVLFHAFRVLIWRNGLSFTQRAQSACCGPGPCHGLCSSPWVLPWPLSQLRAIFRGACAF